MTHPPELTAEEAIALLYAYRDLLPPAYRMQYAQALLAILREIAAWQDTQRLLIDGGYGW